MTNQNVADRLATIPGLSADDLAALTERVSAYAEGRVVSAVTDMIVHVVNVNRGNGDSVGTILGLAFPGNVGTTYNDSGDRWINVQSIDSGETFYWLGEYEKPAPLVFAFVTDAECNTPGRITATSPDSNPEVDDAVDYGDDTDDLA